MNTNNYTINVSDTPVEVIRKSVKNLHLSVYPPNGHVRITVPERMEDENIRLAVISRLEWIREKQSEFKAQPRQTERQYISGESHYFEGKRYLLNVIERKGKEKVELTNNAKLILYIKPNTTRDWRAAIFNEWYRVHLKNKLSQLLLKWQAKVGKKPNHIQIKRMKTRWGSCNTQTGRILINLELAKKPPECLEYILVHELVHLHERHHNEAFIRHMNRCMPKWKFYRDTLKSEPLAHEDWDY
ncbi:MAG: SprT family zinc-dependent metalloprotease [Emcibacteraceae bacterium]